MDQSRYETTASELAEGAEQLRRRAAIGDRCMALAHDGPWTALGWVEGEDRETAASDAVSDILTALFGPAGTDSIGNGITLDPFALNEARRVAENALRSYEGDAEDYCREPQPGEYGYLEPN